MTMKVQVGINYPWYKYGWDFGTPPKHWKKLDWKSIVKKDIIELKRLGFFAMRWFILGDGLTYGKGNYAPHSDPAKKRQWRFDDPPELNKKFLRDFEWLLRCLQKYEMKFVPSLIDFRWCLPGNPVSQNKDEASSLIQKGRVDILIDKSKWQKFFKRVLKPLLEVSKRYRSVILAWELINEPECIVKESRVTFSDIKEFLKAGIGRINAAGFASTIGFARWESLTQWDSAGLGVTLHQFHYYPQPTLKPAENKLHPHRFASEFPCFIGEFATTTDEYPGEYIYYWPELDLDQSVYAKLILIEKKKYPYAFLWSMRAKDKATEWSQQTRDSFSKYKENNNE